MPENNVTVSILSVQSLPDGEEERLEQERPGYLRRTEKGWVLSYQEAPDSGLGDTRTTLRLEEDRAALLRTGETASRLAFRAGEEDTSLYETPYGKLSMTVRTERLLVELDDHGGRVEIDYQMELGGAPAGSFRLRVTVREGERA